MTDRLSPHPVCELLQDDTYESGWYVLPMFQDNDHDPIAVHSLPANDDRRHQLDEACWCQPRYLVAPVGFVDEIVHNSADGREDYEQGRRKPH